MEFAGDFEFGFAGEIVDFFFAFDDETEGRRLDAAGGDSARNFATHDAREVVADEHIEGLASLLRGDHIHIDGAGIFDSFFEGRLRDFVESDTLRSLREFQNFHQMPRNCLAFAVFIGR